MKDFHWPRELYALLIAAETGALKARPLYPVEINALCKLTAGVIVGESDVSIAPEATIARQNEYKGDDRSFVDQRETRAVYRFEKRLSGGHLWQIFLFTAWTPANRPTAEMESRTRLRPKNIEHAATRLKEMA